MITLFIILMILAVIIMVICGASMVLIDPIIAVLIIFGIYKLVKKLFFHKK